MSNAKENRALELDEEWVELIDSARSMGLTLEEIRQFLHNANQAIAEFTHVMAFRRQSPDTSS